MLLCDWFVALTYKYCRHVNYCAGTAIRPPENAERSNSFISFWPVTMIGILSDDSTLVVVALAVDDVRTRSESSDERSREEVLHEYSNVRLATN